MSKVTRIVSAIQGDDSRRAEELLPAVYTELRQLAAQRMAHERPGQTLQATALVHEAWLRLMREEDRTWNDSHHFFCCDRYRHGQRGLSSLLLLPLPRRCCSSLIRVWYRSLKRLARR